MTYKAPVSDIRFMLEHVIGVKALERGYPDFNAELMDAVLGEAGRFAGDVIAPLNRTGDLKGCRLENGVVSTPPGYASAFKRFAEAGWTGITAKPEWGGQGLPRTLAAAVEEMWTGSSMAFSLCSVLSQGAIELLSVYGAPEQQRLYLPNLVAGRWTGTMNLTEPQAGSDVGAVKTRAVRAGDGSYRITGTKIFITYGEHDMAENIVHLVLARLPEAPPGTKGISLFLVPKFLPQPDGSLGPRNDLRCLSLEHKLGLHGSPTCVMTYGENEGATGFLVGEEQGGMRAMFTMMNNARLGVGLEGVGIGEAATQKALAFASERVQSKTIDGGATILHHPDVARMVLKAKALTAAARAICYATAFAGDEAHTAGSEDALAQGKACADFLTPIAKAFSTDIGVETASLALQVHGGMGYIEETGVAQLWRDSRIAPIYEGTNGIQAIDLVTRKLGLRGGETERFFLAEMVATAKALGANSETLSPLAAQLEAACRAMADAGAYLHEARADRPADALAGATAYLRLAGLALGGHYLARGALSKAASPGWWRMTAFYLARILPEVAALKTEVLAGGATLSGLAAGELAV